jgi:hypothetical protein
MIVGSFGLKGALGARSEQDRRRQRQGGPEMP